MNNQNTLSFDFEVSFLPVKVGEVELRFMNTQETLVKLKTMAEDPEKFFTERMPETTETLKTLEENIINNDNADIETLKEYLDSVVVMWRTVFDEMFFKGDFDKLYNRYPDIEQLSAVFPALFECIGKEFGESFKYKEREYKKKVSQILRKKKQKRQRR